MYVGLKQPRGNGERYVPPARAAAKETRWGGGGGGTPINFGEVFAAKGRKP